jgi:signal transduction histidine kinase
VKKLSTRIYVHLLGVLGVAAMVGAGLVAFGWHAYVHNTAVRLARHAAALIGERWAEPVARQRVMRRLADRLDLDITLRSPDGDLLAAIGPELPTPPPERLARARMFAVDVEVRRGRTWSAVAVVRHENAGEPLGVLEVYPAHPVRPPNMALRLFALGLVVIGGSVVTVPLARRISRPVEQLTLASRRFGNGELSYRIADDGRDDELAQLVRSWNEMAARVEAVVRGQKELMANVSHELRSPLARIRVALELLPRDAGSAARLDDVTRDIDELDRLIEDVLTSSRLEATGLPARLERVDAAAIVRELAARAELDPRLTGKVHAELATSPIDVMADGALLRRALWNLVENANKYGTAPIVLAAERASACVRLSVSDEGPGIPPGERERVFEPFYRADRARTPGGPQRGFGLGLTLARTIALAHGGTIQIGATHAREGGQTERGCRLTIELPVPA